MNNHMKDVNEVFTVVVLCYNNEHFLMNALDSILNQKYGEIEIIVADDKSKKFDINSVAQYITKKKRENIVNFSVYQNEANFGTVKNINNALKRATGKYIKILAADDALYATNTLSNASNALKKSKNGIVSGRVYKCDPKNLDVIKPFPDYKLESLTAFECYRKLCTSNRIIAGGVFFTASFFETYGTFDERFRLCEDWPMWLRFTYKGGTFDFADFDAIKYRCDVGVGHSVNPIIIKDRKDIFDDLIKIHKTEIGFYTYLKASVSSFIRSSLLIRRLYNFALKAKTR